VLFRSYYAKRAVPSGSFVTNEDFGQSACVLQNPSSANTIAKTDAYVQVTNPIVTSGAVRGLTATYPLTNDQDSDNTGASADAISYRFDWATNQIDTSAGNAMGLVRSDIKSFLISALEV
jgi:hypothetical protein